MSNFRKKAVRLFGQFEAGESFMDTRDVQPSIWYYGLAVLIIIVGFVAFAGYLFSGVSSMESGLMQMMAPGNTELDLK